MDILDVGINKGMEIGREQGLKFDLLEDKAQEYMDKYWK